MGSTFGISGRPFSIMRRNGGRPFGSGGDRDFLKDVIWLHWRMRKRKRGRGK